MKTQPFLFIISCVFLFACTKPSSANAKNSLHGWQLLQKYQAVVATAQTIKPRPDSAVLLMLNADSTYFSFLNNDTISKGTYSIYTDTAGFGPILQLNNFKTTGIFSLLTLYEIGQTGQVISEFSGLFMYINSDTLTLSSPPTPGGNVVYTFIKK